MARYNIYYHRYNIIARDYIPYVRVVETEDVYREIGSRLTIKANKRGCCSPRLYIIVPTARLRVATAGSERHEPRQPSPKGRKPEHN